MAPRDAALDHGDGETIAIEDDQLSNTGLLRMTLSCRLRKLARGGQKISWT